MTDAISIGEAAAEAERVLSRTRVRARAAFEDGRQHAVAFSNAQPDANPFLPSRNAFDPTRAIGWRRGFHVGRSRPRRRLTPDEAGEQYLKILSFLRRRYDPERNHSALDPDVVTILADLADDIYIPMTRSER